MQHPTRPIIRLDDPAYAELHAPHAATLFVPGSWSGRRLWLLPRPPASWHGVRTVGGAAAPSASGWELTHLLAPGCSQMIWVSGGSIAGALLQASDPFYLASVAVSPLPPAHLRLEVRFGSSPRAAGREGPLELWFNLSDERGELVTRQIVPIGSDEEAVMMKLPLGWSPLGRLPLGEAAGGGYRLNIVACLGEQIIDDYRLDLMIDETGGERAWMPGHLP